MFSARTEDIQPIAVFKIEQRFEDNLIGKRLISAIEYGMKAM